MKRRDFLVAIGLLPFMSKVIVAEPRKWKYTASRLPLKHNFPVIRLNELGNLANEDHVFEGVSWIEYPRYRFGPYSERFVVKARITHAWLLEKDRREYIDMIWVEGKLVKVRNKFYWGVVKATQIDAVLYIERTDQSKTSDER
jgi:hypothetical protein